ncbi:MAG: redoxin domain-containing protein [SAR324 cluster bacterium]|nr:redoxin domain-containing protein [SAR324 cluster bacterium]
MNISMVRRRLLILPGLLIALLAIAGVAFGNPSLTRLQEMLELTSYPPEWKPPDFRTVTPDGQIVSLTGLRGKVVLVNFWASWCAPCREEMPAIERLHRAYGRQGLAVVAINIQELPGRIKRFGERLGLTFPLLLDLDGSIAKQYGVIGLPATFFIGRDGRPVALAIGERAWDSEAGHAYIRTLLAEPAEARSAG